MRFSRSLSEMRPLRLLRASEHVARRAAPGSCSALRAQPRRGLDRAEQHDRELVAELGDAREHVAVAQQRLARARREPHEHVVGLEAVEPRLRLERVP